MFIWLFCRCKCEWQILCSKKTFLISLSSLWGMLSFDLCSCILFSQQICFWLRVLNSTKSHLDSICITFGFCIPAIFRFITYLVLAEYLYYHTTHNYLISSHHADIIRQVKISKIHPPRWKFELVHFCERKVLRRMDLKPYGRNQRMWERSARKESKNDYKSDVNKPVKALIRY